MICTVVVAHNSSKPFTHAFWPLRLLRGCDPNAVVSGFFVGEGIPQGGIANGLHGLNPRNTAHSTPLCKMRPALVWRLVNHKYTVVTRLVDKVNKLVIRTWGLLINQLVWSGSDTSVSTLGRTIIKSKVKEREYV
jgi:hypothetical protein